MWLWLWLWLLLVIVVLLQYWNVDELAVTHVTTLLFVVIVVDCNIAETDESRKASRAHISVD